MARAGDVIEHPVTGERITFLETADDTGGEYVRSELRVQPHGFVAAPHVHPRLEETFEILSGTFTFVVDGEERQVGPGEGASIPAGTPHAWWNAGEEEGVAIVEFRPALSLPPPPRDRIADGARRLTQRTTREELRDARELFLRQERRAGGSGADLDRQSGVGPTVPGLRSSRRPALAPRGGRAPRVGRGPSPARRPAARSGVIRGWGRSPRPPRAKERYGHHTRH